jgi:hypothetical protein
MQRIAIEVPIMAVAAILMASMVLAGGSAIPPPAEPLLLPSRPVASDISDTTRCLEAPVTTPSAAGAVGRATLCQTGRDLHTTLRADGLALGVVYTAWLGYTVQPPPCQGSPCGPFGLPGEQPTEFTQQIGGGVVPASGTLEVDAQIREFRPMSGGQVSLLLLLPTGEASPLAQATFLVP